MNVRSYNKTIRIRLVESFLSSIVGTAIIPFISIYFTKQYGGVSAGIIMASTIFVAALTGFAGGYYADKIGRKKIMMYSELGRLISYLFLAFFNTPYYFSPAATVFLMILISFFSGLSTPAAQAMMIDVTNTENRKKVYTIQYWSINGGMVLGGLLGGALFKNHIILLFLGISSLSLTSLILVSFFIRESFHPLQKKEAINRGRIFLNYGEVLKDKVFVLFTLSTLLALSIEFQARNYVGIRLVKEMKHHVLFSTDHYSFSIDGFKMFGFLNAENALMVVFLGMIMPKILKSVKVKSPLFLGILINSFFFFLIGISNSPYLLAFSMIFATAGEVMYWPVSQAILADIVPNEKRSSYMAVNGLVFRGASMLGSLSITLSSFANSWWISSVFILTGLISILLFRLTFSLMSRKAQVSNPSCVEVVIS